MRRRRWGFALVAALVGLFVFAVIFGKRQVERNAIRDMEPDARRALYESTLQSARALCARAAVEPAFTERCYSQAEFLRSFPECDAKCAELVDTYRREPTR